MVFFIVIYAIEIPIGPAHFKASTASLVDVAITIADDVFERVTARPNSMASSAVLCHSIGTAEIIPRTKQLDLASSRVIPVSISDNQ